MTLSAKLGFASLLLMASSVVTSSLRSPLSFAAAVIALVLGSIAAQRGSKRWLAVPLSIVALGGLLFFVSWQAS
jgi:hypothetical protein